MLSSLLDYMLIKAAISKEIAAFFTLFGVIISVMQHFFY